MPSPANLRARRNTLAAQRASGAARVSFDGKSVEYRSVAEIGRALEALDREIAAAEQLKALHLDTGAGASKRPPRLHQVRIAS